MTGNGHDPAVTDLGAVLERTKPTRTIHLPRFVTNDDVTLYELADVGAALGLTPADMSSLGEGWGALHFQQALVWVVLRREEPDLTWEDARTFRIELPDPTTPASAGASQSAPVGPGSSSIQRVAPASARPKRGR